MPWGEDGEADIAVAMSMQPDDEPWHCSSKEATRVFCNKNNALVHVAELR